MLPSVNIIDTETTPTLKTPTARRRSRSSLLALGDRWSRLRQIPHFEQVQYALAALICCVGAVVRAHHLNTQSLWLDELAEGSAARLSLGDFFVRVRYHAGATPLDYLGVKLVTSVFGYSTVATRSWAYVLGCAAVLMMYLVGSALFKSKTVGLVAAFMLALSGYHVYYSQEARYYSLWALMTLVSLYFFQRALEQRSRNGWLAFAVTVALTLYSGYFLALILLLEALYLFAYWAVLWVSIQFKLSVLLEGVRQIAWGAGAFVLGSVLFLPWFFFAFFQQANTFWSGPLPPLTFDRVQQIFVVLIAAAHYAYNTDLDTRAQILVTLLVVGLALLGLLLAAAAGRPIALIVAVAATVAVPLAWAVDTRSHYFWNERQVIFVIPLVYLLAAAGAGYTIDALAQWLGQRYSGQARAALSPAWITSGQRTSPETGPAAPETGPAARRRDHAQLEKRSQFISYGAVLTGLLVFALAWAAANRPSLSTVYASAFIPKEDWRGAAAYVAAHSCPSSHFYSVLTLGNDYGIGYYDPALLPRMSWVYGPIVRKYYGPSAVQFVYLGLDQYNAALSRLIETTTFHRHDWLILFTYYGPARDYLLQHGWQVRDFDSVTVLYQPGPC